MCPATALTIERLFKDSGVPDHVFKTLLVDSRAAMQLIERELVDGVSLTGSVEAGSQIASLAGRHIKKFVLELGGSDPFIVLEDADIPKTARMALQARMINSGQSCIAAKRFIVMAAVARPFMEALETEVNGSKSVTPWNRQQRSAPSPSGNLWRFFPGSWKMPSGKGLGSFMALLRLPARGSFSARPSSAR